MIGTREPAMIGGALIRASDAHDIDAFFLRGMNLRQRAGHVVRLGLGHRLHSHDVVAADRPAANHTGARLASGYLKAHRAPLLRSLSF
jgi:hypothetical protein